jgi:ABC-2 type transport system ATP-binding protein
MTKKKKSAETAAIETTGLTKKKSAETAAIEITGLTKKYGDLVALAPLDLRIASGERVALIGANGSGKTTLMRLITGLIDRSDGEVAVHGHEVGSVEARGLLSYIPDDPVLYDDLSVIEHLEYLGPLYGATDWQERGGELVERLGIAHRVDDLPSGFSRGLRQKTALAVGFMRPFEVLMLDEPFVGLDEPGRKALLELLDEEQARGVTVVVASHQLDLVERAQRCIALSEGKVIYDGDPKKADLDDLV